MDAVLYLRSVAALVLVLGLILAGLWLLRRYGLAGGVRVNGRRRLALLESLPLDAKHRLVLIRCDDAEHLLVLGGNSDLVVDRQVTRPPSAPIVEGTDP